MASDSFEFTPQFASELRRYADHLEATGQLGGTVELKTEDLPSYRIGIAVLAIPSVHSQDFDPTVFAPPFLSTLRGQREFLQAHGARR